MRKTTNGRNIIHTPIIKVDKFVVMPRFGTDLHKADPLMRKEFYPGMKKDIDSKEKLGKSLLKRLIAKLRNDTIEDAHKAAHDFASKYGLDQVNILRKQRLTSRARNNSLAYS